MKFTLKQIVLFFAVVIKVNSSIAQHGLVTKETDTLPTATLDSIIINSYIRSKDQTYLPDVQDMNIFSGKKTNSIQLNSSTANLAQNLARTAFAQIPGLTMWDMDGAGTQVNIGSRSTDSHRSIEMNMRQNGYNTNSDIFGYPENHYTVPMQAIQEVQLVRGSAALQFGPQFGGMMNYIIKEGDSCKPFAIESEQTTGSNDFFNSFNAVGGTKGKLNYYAYYDYRHGDGWRPNAAFNYHAYYVNLRYQFNKRTSIALQFSRMDYIQQIAGGLTDEQFENNAKQSFRTRNFFQPVINIPTLIFKYNLSNDTRLQITVNGLFGERNSVQFINPPNILDTVNVSLGSYNPRQVDRDFYSGFTTEARLLHAYRIGSVKSVLSAGLRYFNETTKRKQKGVGTTGSDFDLTLTKYYSTDLHLTTQNEAVFAENIFQLNKRFSVTPGFRYSLINTRLNGIMSDTVHVAYKGKRNFPLFGTGLQYQLTQTTQLYGNISQAYRPYLYANVTPSDRIDVIDPNLKDSKGYDIDLGYRGHYKDAISFDVNAYYLFYGDRIGLISQLKDNSTYLLTTNIGNSVAKGVEAYVNISLLYFINHSRKNYDIRLFNSLAYDHARYTSGELNKSGLNVSVKGNHVENTPDWMNRCGIEFQLKNITANFQYSYTSTTYNDAFNTVQSSNGVTGIIPAYHLLDWSFNWRSAKLYHISGGINNFTNEKYFSRRITMYPGPGILPADGRTFYISFGVKM